MAYYCCVRVKVVSTGEGEPHYHLEQMKVLASSMAFSDTTPAGVGGPVTASGR